jgi:hypothetical protein
MGRLAEALAVAMELGRSTITEALHARRVEADATRSPLKSRRCFALFLSSAKARTLRTAILRLGLHSGSAVSNPVTYAQQAGGESLLAVLAARIRGAFKAFRARDTAAATLLRRGVASGDGKPDAPVGAPDSASDDLNARVGTAGSASAARATTPAPRWRSLHEAPDDV